MKSLFCAVCATTLMAVAGNASTISRIVLKASDAPAQTGTDVVDPYLDWVNDGGVNEGVAGATDLTNNGVDYKDSWVDTNWSIVDTVRVSMNADGVEVAYLEFDAAGTSKDDFFTLSNLTGSTWGTSGFDGQAADARTSGDWFSIAGDTRHHRHWYVNNLYGGCGGDLGFMVVLDGTEGSEPCGWERRADDAVAGGSDTRGFVYSTEPGAQQFFGTNYGVADVFSISVSYMDPNVVPLPASSLLLLGGLGGLVAMRRRKRA